VLIIDVHTHVHPMDAAAIYRAARRLGIKLWVSHWTGGERPGKEAIREGNDVVLKAMRDQPDLVIGYCTLNPMHGKRFCLEEIERCVVQGGMSGIKLWCAVIMSNAKVDCIAERAAELRIPILQHTWYKTVRKLRWESCPADVAECARRHPRTTIIMAHLRGCRFRGVDDIAECPNVVVETSGGDVEQGYLEYAARVLGEGRVLYGSDLPGRGAGKQLSSIAAASLSQTAQEKILGANALAILGRTPEASRAHVARVLAGAGPLSAKGDFYRRLLRPPADLKAIDVAAHLGVYAFNTAIRAEVGQIVARMDQEGIDRAVVSPIEPLFDHNPSVHNDELLRAIRGSRRLVGAVVVNCTYPGWQKRLQVWVSEGGARMAKLHPSYHGYTLDASCAGECARAAGELGIPLFVAMEVEDQRGQHAGALFPPVMLDEVLAFARRHPATKIIAGAGKLRPVSVGKVLPLPPNLYFEISHFDGLLGLKSVLERIPASRLLWGTHQPFLYPRATYAYVLESDVSSETLQLIARRNAMEVLGLKSG